MNIVSLHQPKPCESVVDGLRRLADQIEANDPDWPVTTCVVLLGHTDTESRPDENGYTWQRNHWRSHGYGIRTDSFTVRGLMVSVLNDWESE